MGADSLVLRLSEAEIHNLDQTIYRHHDDNEHFGSQCMPIRMQQLNENSNELNIDQQGRRWISSPQ